MRSVEVMPSGELPIGKMKRIKIGPIPAVIVRRKDNSLRAVAANCLHMGGPLEFGSLGRRPDPSTDSHDHPGKDDDIVIRCPWHGYEYDLDTGETLVAPKRALRVFKCWDSDGTIMAEF